MLTAVKAQANMYNTRFSTKVLVEDKHHNTVVRVH